MDIIAKIGNDAFPVKTTHTKQVTDPAGTVNQSTFDDAGRITQLLENYVYEGGDPDENRETDYTYDPNGQISTLTAKNSTTGDQVTQFVYGTTLDESYVASNELLATKIFPDDGEETYAYDALGEMIGRIDPNGTYHYYAYDTLNRLVWEDTWPGEGSGIDDAAYGISHSYEIRGLLQDVTHNGSDLTYDVQYVYNEFQQLVAEYQEHAGYVDTDTSPCIQYGYEDGSANTVRLTSVTYPDGRELTYDYGESGEMGDALSRIESIADGETTLAEYTYLGLGTTVEVDYDEPGVDMTYISDTTGDAGDQYIGLDRFGRIVDARWINGESTDIERVQYAYDRASMRLSRYNTVNSSQDESYSYDGLDQLTQLQRGSGGTPSWEEDFEYDPTGNWNNYTNLIDGTTNLDQDRTHNMANETTALDDSSSLVGYDATGNMTTTPQPDDWDDSYQLIYDAWNRLVKVMDGETAVATYRYDGLHRRILKVIGDETRHYYYSSRWQVLEERLEGESSSSSSDYVANRQFVWGLRGIDDLILRDRYGDSDERLYALGDAMSVTAVTDTSGEVQERYGYDAFGNTNVMDADFDSEDASAYDWEIRFCSYRWDGETNFYQVRYCYLHTSLGKWLTRDPIGERGGMNLYMYVRNNAISRNDPFGLDTISKSVTDNVDVTDSAGKKELPCGTLTFAHVYVDASTTGNIQGENAEAYTDLIQSIPGGPGGKQNTIGDANYLGAGFVVAFSPKSCCKSFFWRQYKAKDKGKDHHKEWVVDYDWPVGSPNGADLPGQTAAFYGIDRIDQYILELLCVTSEHPKGEVIEKIYWTMHLKYKGTSATIDLNINY